MEVVKRADKSSKKKKVIKGTVIAETERFIVLQTEHYRECILKVDFKTGEAQIV